MDQYACDKCDCEYWTMGDPVKAQKVHQLAHLVIEQDQKLRALEVPANQVMDYVRERIGNMRFAQDLAARLLSKSLVGRKIHAVCIKILRNYQTNLIG